MAKTLRGRAKKETPAEKRARVERIRVAKENFANLYLPIILAILFLFVIYLVWTI